MGKYSTEEAALLGVAEMIRSSGPQAVATLALGSALTCGLRGLSRRFSRAPSGSSCTAAIATNGTFSGAIASPRQFSFCKLPAA